MVRPDFGVYDDDEYVDVLSACGAPGGAEAWVARVISAPGYSARFDPLDGLAVDEAPASRRVFVTSPHESPQWARRLSLLRYRYLSSFYAPEPPQETARVYRAHQFEMDADVERRHPVLWRKWWKKLNAERDARLALEHAIQERRRTDGATSERNALLQAIFNGLTRLYFEMFGVSVTGTINGPADRFAVAFFEDCGKSWGWIWASDCRVRRDYPEFRHETPLTKLARSNIPASNQRQYRLRSALKDNHAVQQAIQDHLELISIYSPTRGHRPVPGAFAMIDPTNGREKWGSKHGEMPQIFPKTD